MENWSVRPFLSKLHHQNPFLALPSAQTPQRSKQAGDVISKRSPGGPPCASQDIPWTSVGPLASLNQASYLPLPSRRARPARLRSPCCLARNAHARRRVPSSSSSRCARRPLPPTCTSPRRLHPTRTHTARPRPPHGPPTQPHGRLCDDNDDGTTTTARSPP